MLVLHGFACFDEVVVGLAQGLVPVEDVGHLWVLVVVGGPDLLQVLLVFAEVPDLVLIALLVLAQLFDLPLQVYVGTKPYF